MSGQLSNSERASLARISIRLADALAAAVELLDMAEKLSMRVPLSSPLGGALLGNVTRGFVVARIGQIRTEAERILRDLGEVQR